MTGLFVVLAIIGVCSIPWLCLVLGMRGSDFLFLAAVTLPAVWLSRFNLYYVSIGGLPFSLLWGVLASIFIVLLCFGNPHTRWLLTRSSRGVLILLALLVAVLGLSTAANHETTQDLVRGFQATGFVVLPPLAAWAVVRCCRVDEARITRAVGSLFLVGLFISVLSVLTAAVPGLFGGVITTYKTEIETGRAFSPLGGPSATAMCLLMVYCLSAGRLQSGRWRILAIAVLAMCFLALLTTLARSA